MGVRNIDRAGSAKDVDFISPNCRFHITEVSISYHCHAACSESAVRLVSWQLVERGRSPCRRQLASEDDVNQRSNLTTDAIVRALNDAVGETIDSLGLVLIAVIVAPEAFFRFCPETPCHG
jgi:hypothetical protein